MRSTISRRSALLNAVLLPAGLVQLARESDSELNQKFSALEKDSGGRLGVAMLDTGGGLRAGHRADQRFPMCSTFKFLAVAAVLARVDLGREPLDRRIAFGAADLLEYAPVTSARLAEGSMPLADLCEAAITVSDNTAANLILATLGGPAGLTSYVRSLGDRVTRLDRFEPALNEATPRDVRDTTTPSAMLGNMRTLLVGGALSQASRDKLIAWLVAARTGGRRLRAGVPAGWRVGDKTGSGSHGTTNDIGIIWPPGREPILVAAYLTGTSHGDAQREAVLARIARLIAGLKTM